jgi:hypothetical protein
VRPGPPVVGRNKKNKKKRHKRCRSCGPCQRCRKGRCMPQSNGTPCGACQTCQNDACVLTPGAACGSGGQCLANGSCALVCDLSQIGSCPAGCFCGGNVDGPATCFREPGAVCDEPHACAVTATCPPGRSCFSVQCAITFDHRCLPLCST